MTAGRAGDMLQRIAQGVADFLLRFVYWHVSGSRSLSRQPGEHFPLVIILGREHYSERRKSYPALRRRDLENVLREELAGDPPTLTLLGPVNGDKREVSFYRLDSAVIESLPHSLFMVPESVLLGLKLPAAGWADVERQGYRYFLFHSGPSQPAGGALAARELVAMAAGIDPEQAPEEWRGSEQLRRRLRRALPALPALAWWSFRNPKARGFGFGSLAWKPLASVAGVMLFAYLMVSSIYLQALLGHRENTLKALGSDIQVALVADNDARALAARRDALIGFWSGRPDTQRLWQGVAVALQNKASINGFELHDGRISLRGEAPDASEILAVLASTPGFAEVSFDAPVRSGRNGRQNFALSFVLSDASPALENTNE